MRKFFTTIVMAALALTASATDYNDNMRVTLDGNTLQRCHNNQRRR